MVRLRVYAGLGTFLIVDQFQFHDGPIERPKPFLGFQDAAGEFQFHDGPIESSPDGSRESNK
mgnify:CR=1 FL=1